MALNPAQERAALLLAEGVPVTKVAEAISRSKNTIHDWKKKNAEFRARVKELRRNITQETVDYLRGNLLNNVEIIQEIAEGKAFIPYKGVDGIVVVPETSGINTRLRAAMWAAEKILKPAIKDAASALPALDPEKKKREAEAALVQMGEDDLDDLVSRGLE